MSGEAATTGAAVPVPLRCPGRESVLLLHLVNLKEMFAQRLREQGLDLSDKQANKWEVFLIYVYMDSCPACWRCQKYPLQWPLK